MKCSPFKYVVVSLLFMAANADLRAGTPEPDPLIGHWFWHHNILVAFKADGTATSNIKSEGVWEFLKNAEVERKYHVNWDHGKYIDTVILSKDGKSANLVSKVGKYSIHRTTD